MHRTPINAATTAAARPARLSGPGGALLATGPALLAGAVLLAGSAPATGSGPASTEAGLNSDAPAGTATSPATGAAVAGSGFGLDATALAFDPDSRVLAEGRFLADGDRFELTSRAGGGERAYLQFKYIRADGTFQGGEHWGSAVAGSAVVFDHDFGEGRKVLFRVCSGSWCSGTAGGENWTAGYA
jgi:hypothetical protein